MRKQIIISLKLLLIMTFLTGVIYPVFVTVVSNLIFPFRSQGSLIIAGDKVIGSELLGQNFSDDKYFQPRPSQIGYNPLPSGASNYGPTSKTLQDSINQRRTAYIQNNQLSPDTKIPEDALFSSGSGVDPHISLENVKLQFVRVTKTRNFDEDKKAKLWGLINILNENPQFGILGEERINVLLLNLTLDSIK